MSIRTLRLPLAGALLAAATGGCKTPATDGTNPAGGNPLGQNLVIEGSVSGLLGAGLVMLYNGTREAPVPPGAPGFVFTGISEKSDYAITVKSQPTGPAQNCTVSNGSGKIVYDPIRNVAVACVTRSFDIRLGITGLTGSGLTLLLNGANAQTVAPGTTVATFASVVSGTAYAITIGTQPSGQTCIVNGGTGTMGAADVSTVAVTCGAVGLTVGGTVIGLGSNGLSLRLNAGAPLSIASGASSFTFPSTLPSGTSYSAIITSPPSGPLQSCMLGRGKGTLGSTVITDMLVRCFSNGTLDSYTGTYAIALNGRRQFLTLWFDGTYSAAFRLDDPGCTNNGNGIEYGVYKRTAAGAFFTNFANDDNGKCGLWYGGTTVGAGGGAQGTMTRNGNTLTLTLNAEGELVLTAVESVPTSLVGAFTRADGQDGSFVVFSADGTYLFQETQQSSGTTVVPYGYERGCYTVTGATFTTTLAAACRPDGQPALDQNGTGGFSGRNGAAIPFAITSTTGATINGVAYVRIAPAG